MPPYKESFPVGSTVRIVDHSKLLEFQQTWKLHHKLSAEQLAFAGRPARVKGVTFYHGGDALYELLDAPGIWHEECLRPTSSDQE